MSKRFPVILAGMVFAAWAVLAPPGRSQVIESSGLERLQRELERESARLRNELEKHRAEFARLRDTAISELSAKLEAQRANLVAALESRRAEIQAQAAELEQRAREAAEEALQQAPVVVDREILLDDEGGLGWLGVGIAEVTAEKAKELKLPAERGVLLTEVEADSPAAKAGLKVNDIITEYNAQRVEGTAQFRRLVRETPAGRTVQLTIWRDGRSQTLSVQLGNVRDQIKGRVKVFGPKDFDFHFEMPAIEGLMMSRRPILGIDAEDLSGQLGSYFGAPDGEGVLVREVKPGTPAEKAGLKAGDVIIKVDGERVRTASELRAKMREKREKKTVSVGVIRKGAETSFNVEVEQPKPIERKRLVSRRTAI